MSDFTDNVVAYVRDVSYRKRPPNGWWVVHVDELERQFDCPRSSLMTALRKAEDRKLLRLYGDPPHSCRLGEMR